MKEYFQAKCPPSQQLICCNFEYITEETVAGLIMAETRGGALQNPHDPAVPLPPF